MSNQTAHVHTLAADGVGLSIAVSPDDRLPRIVHWGRDPGEVPLAPYGLSALPVLPMQHEGWAGRPAIAGNRAGRFAHPRLRVTALDFTDNRMTLRATDAEAGLVVGCELVLSPEGVIRARYDLTNAGDDAWHVGSLRCLLPVPDEAVDLLDFTGRWALERFPQRRPFELGSHVRENRRGRTGHDSTTLLCLGNNNFANRSGEVWAVHVGWSGNHEHSAERMPDSVGALGGAELLESGEIRLAKDETYQTPWVYFVWSESGLDGVRDRFHRFIRARETHPRSPRPVVLNTWEAVYFQHDFEKLKELADTAASVGVERFVLDDGWFGARRDDRAGLGDWFVSPDVWPDGLQPLAEHVHQQGMQFGLWFEPEMVNPDSDLFRAHPDWVLAEPGRLPDEFRQQHVLDLAQPEVSAYLLGRLSTLVDEIGVDFIKWDHNRDLVEAPHVHAQTVAVYRLLDELRRRHPGLEIESCSSGGARIDLGILGRTDRVWTSDTNDPIDRQQIQRWTNLLLPYELMGAHVGPTRTHITGRVTDLAMRCATALFGHAGIERDLTECDSDELRRLTEWIFLYKRTRALIHSGHVVTADRADASVHGVVAIDGSHALFCYAQLTSQPAHTPLRPNPMRLRLPGLDPGTDYRVSVALPAQGGGLVPAVIDLGGGVFSGRFLETVGLPVPRLNPADAFVLEFTAA